MHSQNICATWDEDACSITDVNLEKKGDYFVVTGNAQASTALKCTLPQLRLNVAFLDKNGKKLKIGVLGEKYNDFSVNGDTLHISDRALSPGEATPFKLEGLWDERINSVQVTVRPCLKYPKEA